MHRRDMIYKEVQMVLEFYIFLKKKRDGNINERTVAGGNKQHKYIPKEDANYPTIST